VGDKGSTLKSNVVLIGLKWWRKKSKMVRQVELSNLDLRYESYRLKNPKFKKVFLASILQYV
jgi:hypothetical protein